MDSRRLCHISDLPNNLQFLPIEIKHLLPVHHSKFADNLLTILANQAANLHWPTYMDESLTLSSSNYASTFGGWCEDIDGQPQHLKSTLELSAIVLNYLHSLIITVPAERDSRMQLKVIQRVDVASDEGPIYPSQAPFPISPLLAYNIYKTRDKQQKPKFIFMVGRQFQPELRLFSLLNSVRFWNLHRLKSDACTEVTINRCHRLLEHLAIIFRGFLSTEELDNQVKRRELQMLLQAIDEQTILQVAPCQAIQHQYTVISYRFEWNYKDSQVKKDIFSFCGEALAQILKTMSSNACCSYAGRTVHLPKMNQVILLWLTTHKKIKASRLTYPLNEQPNEEAVKRCVKFLQKKSVENIRDGGINIADEMLKSSLKVLNKYTTQIDKSYIAPSITSSHRQLLSSSSDSFVTDRDQNSQPDRMSAFSKVSFKSRGFHQRSANDLKMSHLVSENFQSLSSPLMAHRDKEYCELLEILEQWERKYNKIYPWTDLRASLRHNCEKAQLKYGKGQLSTEQNTLLLSFSALKYYLQANQIQMLVKNYADYRESIFEVIFQRSNAHILLEVAKKLAKDCAQPLYESYLTKEFKVDRNSPLISFLKRYLITFQLSSHLQDLGDRIPIPVLLSLLESRDYSNPAYREMIAALLGEIFSDDEPVRLISPVLHQIYISLVEDHHEELVNALIGDISFEVLYFSFDSISLSNSPYRCQQDLKQKKFLQVLRDGGFNQLGFELKEHLKPLFFKHSGHNFPQAKIFEEIAINKPVHIVRFMQLLIQSQFTQHLLELGRFYKSMLRAGETITRPIASIYLSNEVAEFRYEIVEERVDLGGVKSQSGIFQHLLNYNPQLKIAGMSLSQIIDRRQTERRTSPRDKFNLDFILQNVLSVNLQECYEYILMVLNLKDKYLHYDSLKEQQKIYLRQIMHQVLCRKSGIYQYLELDAAIKLAQNGARASIY